MIPALACVVELDHTDPALGPWNAIVARRCEPKGELNIGVGQILAIVEIDTTPDVPQAGEGWRTRAEHYHAGVSRGESRLRWPEVSKVKLS